MNKNNGPTRFLDHLEDFRRKVLVWIGFFILLFAVFIVFNSRLVEFFLAYNNTLKVDIIYIKPQEKFIAYLQAALFSSLIVAFPFLLVQIARFILPALYPSEKKGFVLALAIFFIFFAGGNAFAYFILVPFAFRFFHGFGGTSLLFPQWSILSYLRLIFSVHLVIGGFGILPIFLFMGIRTGLLELETVKKYRRHTAVLVFLVAAFITPPDIFTQIAVGFGLYILFELTLMICGIIKKRHD